MSFAPYGKLLSETKRIAREFWEWKTGKEWKHRNGTEGGRREGTNWAEKSGRIAPPSLVVRRSGKH